jgi:hypothetical protein
VPYRLHRIMLAMVVMLTIGLTATAASAAQPSAEQMLAQLDGLETAYARKYVSDDSLGFVTPVVATASTPDTLTVDVLEFGTEENVADAYDNVMTDLVARAILGRMDVDLEQEQIDDLGDQAILFTGVTEFDEHIALLGVQDGNLGILVMAWGDDASMIDTTMAFAEHMVAAEPGDGPVNVDDRGVATGGTFEIMPGSEDSDVLNGLVPLYDYDLLRDGGTEPLGHGQDHS